MSVTSTLFSVGIGFHGIQTLVYVLHIIDSVFSWYILYIGVRDSPLLRMIVNSLGVVLLIWATGK